VAARPFRKPQSQASGVQTSRARSPAHRETSGYRSLDAGVSWERINDDEHQFGGSGNGHFVIGDVNVFGRVYMSTIGLGLVYGDAS